MGGYHSLPELRTAQPEDPLTALAKVAQVRAAMQQAAMAPGQMELQKQAIASGQQEATVRQRAMDEQSTLMQTMAENPGATIGQLVPVLAKSGKVTPQTLFALQQKDTEIRKNTAELDDKTLAVKTAAHAQLQNLYNNAMQMDDQTLAQNWPAIVGQVKTLPGIDKAATMFDPAQPMTRQQLQQYGPVLGLQDAYLKDEAARREASAKAGTAESEQTIKAAEANAAQQYGGISKQMADSKYRFILQKSQSGQPLSADEVNFAKAYELSERKTTTSSDTLGVTSSSTSGPSGFAAVRPRLAAGAPGATPTGSQSAAPAANGNQDVKGNLVDMIGQYKIDPAQLSRLQFKHPEIMGLVSQKYPDWDSTTYTAKNKLIQGYTSGPQSKEINAINTVAGHLDALDGAVAALNNGNVQALNSIANKLGAQVGQTPQTTFQTIVHRIGPEITSAYIPGAGGESERLANAKDFSENLAPQQLHANIATTVGLLRSKIGALENQYKQSVGRDDFQQRFITPAALASFQRLAGVAGGGTQQQHAPGKDAGMPDGTTGKGSDGKPYIVKGGVWVPQQ